MCESRDPLDLLSGDQDDDSSTDTDALTREIHSLDSRSPFTHSHSHTHTSCASDQQAFILSRSCSCCVAAAAAIATTARETKGLDSVQQQQESSSQQQQQQENRGLAIRIPSLDARTPPSH